MRKFCVLTVIFLFTAAFLGAQVNDKYSSAANALQANSHQVVKYSFPKEESGHEVLSLQMPFSSAVFNSPALANRAKGMLIEKVQLIYTTFRVSPSFDQQQLNQQRLKNLLSLLPDAFLNPMTEWELVGQTGATSPEEGRNYFHGFVITWRPASSPKLIKEEMSSLDSIFMPSKKDHRVGLDPHETGKDPVSSKLRMLTMPDGSTTILDRDIPEDSLWMYMKPSDPGYSVVYAKWGDTAHTIVIVEERKEGRKIKRTWKLDDHVSDKPLIGSDISINLHDPDSVVTTVLRRNSWTNMVIVADVTGSMSPYTAQVLAWVPVGLSTGRCSGFVFFNDGDKKNTSDKNIGKTGGIYGIQTQRFDSVYFTMKKTMAAGDGGDLPENPVEATIYSLNHFSNNSEVILVADNFSQPRDLELYEKINRPVHIVLCGARGTVNPDYLFLARQTHGSVHTVHDDINNLDQMKDGDVVVVENKHYMLKNEHFICLDTFSPAQ
jgi:hypothetical protein